MYAMAAVRRKQDPVACFKHAVLVLPLEAQARGTGYENHELVPTLVVPILIERRLPGRDDALQAQARTFQQNVDQFFGLRLGRQCVA